MKKIRSLALMVCAVYLTVCGDANAQTPKVTVYGAIRDKWVAMGGASGKLGQPVDNEKPTFDNVGRWQQFKGGMISWHSQTGAHVVWGLIGEHWLRAGREKFGYPITDELATTGKRHGFYSHFRALHLPNRPEASIFWSKATGAHAVYGAIRDRWAKLDWDRGQLGFPKSDEYQVKVNGGTFQRVDFEDGYILWSAKTGARHTLTSGFKNDTEQNPVSD